VSGRMYIRPGGCGCRHSKSASLSEILESVLCFWFNRTDRAQVAAGGRCPKIGVVLADPELEPIGKQPRTQNGFRVGMTGEARCPVAVVKIAVNKLDASPTYLRIPLLPVYRHVSWGDAS